MTVKELIIALEQMSPDTLVTLTEPDEIGWDNIWKVIEDDGLIITYNIRVYKLKETK